MYKRFFLTFLIIFPLFLSANSPSRTLRINLISERNGRGLQADQEIMKNEILELGHEVNCLVRDAQQDVEADINIFFQTIDLYYLPKAPINWFVPNPEWYTQPLKDLDHIDLVLCRTHEVERIFSSMSKRTYFLGFTSRDCYDSTVGKNYALFGHFAGANIQKGTLALVNVWRQNPLLPQAIVLQYHHQFVPEIHLPNLEWLGEYIPKNRLIFLQNNCGFQLCLSETEGFGHYLMEAMSTMSVVVTTDAPPMNEFITDPRCLVPYSRTSRQFLATNYYVDETALEQKIKALMELPQTELENIGQTNRHNYQIKKQIFKKNLQRLLKSRRYTHVSNDK